MVTWEEEANTLNCRLKALDFKLWPRGSVCLVCQPISEHPTALGSTRRPRLGIPESPVWAWEDPFPKPFPGLGSLLSEPYSKTLGHFFFKLVFVVVVISIYMYVWGCTCPSAPVEVRSEDNF